PRGRSAEARPAITAAAAANAYQTDTDNCTVMQTTAGAFLPTLRRQSAFGGADAFVTKLNPTGSALVYSTYLGGSNDDYAQAIAVDAAGNAYVTGGTFSSDFPTTAGAFHTTFGGGPGGHSVAKKTATTASPLVSSSHLGGAHH